MYKSLLSSTTNTRDLGGYPAAAGKTTARNRIWRSDAPTAWNDADERLLKKLGITAVIDMRTDGEIARKPCAFSLRDGFAYSHIPIAAGSTPPDSLEAVPVTYLEIAAQKETADVLRTIAESRAGVLFCCAAGKDRTGVISALLLLACGVDSQTIVNDYAVSREYNRLRLEQYLAEHPGIDRRIVLANEASMRRFLILFHDCYGSIEAYFEQSGLSSLHLARIRGKLLEG